MEYRVFEKGCTDAWIFPIASSTWSTRRISTAAFFPEYA